MGKVIRNNKELGEVIRFERTRQNMGQVELARKASVRQPLISDLENGETSVRLDTLVKVLAALALDLSVVPRQKAEIDPTEY